MNVKSPPRTPVEWIRKSIFISKTKINNYYIGQKIHGAHKTKVGNTFHWATKFLTGLGGVRQAQAIVQRMGDARRPQ